MTSVTAQISLYPLREQHIGPAIQGTIALLRAAGLAVWEGAMSTVVAGELEEVCAGIQSAFAAAAAQGEAVMVIGLANGCPLPAGPLQTGEVTTGS